MTGPLFDEHVNALRKHRAARIGGDLFLHRRAMDDIVDRVAASGRRFARAALIGCPGDALAVRLAPHTGTLRTIDSAEELEPGGHDLVVALGALDGVNEPQLVLFAMAAALAPGGMLTGATVGGASLPALRSALLAFPVRGRAALRVHPLLDGPALAGLLGALPLERVVIERDLVQASYASLDRLAGDLRAMGCTSRLADRAPLGRAEWAAARRAFETGGGRTVERFELLHFTAFAAA